ncbi:hypothetical protein ANCDUO_06312 [Ancylostoma duodenale]|uniref:Uncharacterized protein n=1 Tax=Ancylostoma duodenale TaxID=51022 RepID=A0A0C2GPX9_9BILA|nr:hypothetical protein ANCDUO_06312 [Ancylostoma duodenale]
MVGIAHSASNVSHDRPTSRFSTSRRGKIGSHTGQSRRGEDSLQSEVLEQQRLPSQSCLWIRRSCRTSSTRDHSYGKTELA